MLREPDGFADDGQPLWKCPECDQLKRLEDFGLRKRDDLYPGQEVYNKQSWCTTCRAKT